MNPLQGKRITLIVTGGIAAYKACELVRLMKHEGADVHVVMTRAACDFVGPLTLATLSGHPVATDAASADMPHLALSRGTDLLLVAPATANILAKAANGIADDLASSLILGRDCPMACAPAMNDRMYAAAPTQRNIAQLEEDGVTMIGPATGELACNVSGKGRMSSPAFILSFLRRLLTPQTLAGRKVVVTAGATYEALDPVRGLTNRSSGRQGCAVARAAFEAGADVTLIAARMEIDAPEAIHTVSVVSAQDMLEAALAHSSDADVFVSVAAVADWRAAEVAENKIKKTAEDASPAFPPLTENADIVASVAAMNPAPLCVGFAAETQNVIENAQKKLAKKKIDLIVANDAGEALGADTNTVTIIDAKAATKVSRTGKDDVAQIIVAQIAHKLAEKAADTGVASC